MKKYIALMALGFLMVASTAASAADWKSEVGGTTKVTTLKPEGIAYVATAGANSEVISVRSCPAITFVVWGTGASVTPQMCLTRACTTAKPLDTTPLTGDTTAVFLASVMPLEFVRVATASSVTVSLKCGAR